MSKYCKYHIKECETVPGGYFCKYCGHKLKEGEIMDLKPSVISPPSVEKNDVCENKKESNTPKEREKTPIKGSLVLWCGIFGLIFPLISAFVIPRSWDSKFLGYVIAFLFLVGIVCTVSGLCIRDNEKEELEDEWARKYSNPQWRNENPDKAAVVEANKKREYLRQNGAAVSINNLQAGYFDRGSAYRASSWSPWANSAGGWSVRYKISNTGARTIKYVTITFVAYNAVGDKCYCRTHNRTDAICKFTGPLNAGYSTDWLLNENLWYDIAMSRVSVEHIYVEFMDGKSQDIYKDGKVENHGF